jgi:putative FmdB family regulatory protein
MPIYEYECLKHGHRFEVMQKMSEEPIQVCQECGGKVRKLISAAGFVMKGSGWFKDGYSSSKPSAPSENSPAPAEATKTTSTETKKTESPASTTPTNKESKS